MYCIIIIITSSLSTSTLIYCATLSNNKINICLNVFSLNKTDDPFLKISGVTFNGLHDISASTRCCHFFFGRFVCVKARLEKPPSIDKSDILKSNTLLGVMCVDFEGKYSRLIQILI